MQIEDNTILIAPGSLHLPLYQEIYRQKGCTLGITVMTLESWLRSRMHTQAKTTLEIVCAYAKALEALPKDNVFYESRSDYDFLSDCLQFLSMASMYQLETKPGSSKREQDLQAVIELLKPIQLWQKEAAQTQFEEAPKLRILKTEWNEAQLHWIELLKKQGAKELSSSFNKRIYYWAASNPRKEMEAAADAILANEIDPSSTLIALSDPGQQACLMQILESRNLPYTLLHPASESKVPDMFMQAWRYMNDKTPQNRERLILSLFGQMGAEIVRGLRLLEDGADLQNLQYKDNSLISEEKLTNLQSLQITIRDWQPVLEEIDAWTPASFSKIATRIQKQIPQPKAEDIQAFDGILNAWNSLPDQSDPVMQQLFGRSLEHLHPSRSLDENRGISIGTRADISALHKTVFYIGADAEHYPGSIQHGGAFGEEYLQSQDYPSLAKRMEDHSRNLQEVLKEPETVYILMPQSDEEGKNVEESHELNTWLELLPKFQQAAETGALYTPDFSMPPQTARSYFQKEEGILSASLRSLDMYQDCPLKSLLRYGLHLSRPMEAGSALRVDKDFIKRRIEDCSRLGRPLSSFSKEELYNLVYADFSFALSVFPSRQEEVQTLCIEYTERLHSVFQNLALAQDEWKMRFAPGDYRISLDQNGKSGPISITGGIGSSSRASLNLYSQDTDFFALETAPAGTLDFSLQPKPKNRSAFSVSYGRGAATATSRQTAPQDAANETRTAFFRSALKAQNLPDLTDETAQALKKKIPTYEQKEQDALEKAKAFAQGVADSRFHPLHAASACSYCSYQAICRNAACERGK